MPKVYNQLERVRHPARARHHLAAVLRSIPAIQAAIAAAAPETKAPAGELAQALATVQRLMESPPETR